MAMEQKSETASVSEGDCLTPAEKQELFFKWRPLAQKMATKKFLKILSTGRVSRRDYSLKSELYQAAQFGLWRGLGLFRKSFGTKPQTICGWYILAELRDAGLQIRMVGSRQKPWRRSKGDAFVMSLPQKSDEWQEASESVPSDFWQRVRQVLSDDNWKAVQAVYIDGLTSVEAGRLMGITAFGVRERLRVARKFLRKENWLYTVACSLTGDFAVQANDCF